MTSRERQNLIYIAHLIRVESKKDPLDFQGAYDAVTRELGHMSMATVRIAHDNLISTGQLKLTAGGLYEMTPAGNERLQVDLYGLGLAHLS